MKQSAIKRKKVLFFSEAVTLAHIVRPIVLAKSLDPLSYESVLVAHPRYRQLFPDIKLRFIDVNSISPNQFINALAKGKPLYDLETLSR